jgi:hypothetical protein
VIEGGEIPVIVGNAADTEIVIACNGLEADFCCS